MTFLGEQGPMGFYLHEFETVRLPFHVLGTLRRNTTSVRPLTLDLSCMDYTKSGR